jgi:hypothetical protein
MRIVHTLSQLFLGLFLFFQLRSSRPDAFEKALAVVRLVESSETWAFHLTPTTSICNDLLRILLAANPKVVDDAGKLASQILDEMDMRHSLGLAHTQPDNETLTIVLKILLRQGDLEKSDALMSRMEATGTLKDRMVYHEILNYYSRLKSIPAAERAEKTLHHMKQSAKQGNVGMQPNCFTYNTVISAFLGTRVHEGCERAWRLFLQMKEDHVEPNLVTFTTLIQTFSKSFDVDLVVKAELLLDEMDLHDVLADHRHYYPVIMGFLTCDAVPRATKVLMQSIETYLKDTNTRELATPNHIIMDMVMQGWARKGDLTRATELIHSLNEMYEVQKLPSGPSLRTFFNLRYKWMKSDFPDRNDQIAKLDKVIAEIKTKHVKRKKKNEKRDQIIPTNELTVGSTVV